MTVDLELILIGLIVGFLVGLTGVGGGSIMTPLLVQVLRVNPLTAVGTDLLYSVPTRLYAAFLHRQQGTVNPHIVKALLWGGLPASFAGLGLLFWLRHHVDIAVIELWTRRAIGVTLLLAAGMILAQPWLKRLELQAWSEEFQWRPRQRARVIAIGAVVGLCVTLTSIGSGAVTLPLLTLAMPFVGSDGVDRFRHRVCRLFDSGRGVRPLDDGRRQRGFGDQPAHRIASGRLYIGSRLCRRMHARWLRPAVAVTLLFVGARLI